MPGAALLGVGGAGASRRVKGETGKATAALPTAGVLSLLEWFYGKSSFLMGKSTIFIAIFNSYVKLPEGRI